MIRRATPDDAEAVAEVFTRSFGTLDFLPKLHTPEEDRAHMAKIVSEQDVWVAVEDGSVEGFIAFERDLGTFFYVEPEAQKRGVGSALFEHVCGERPGGFTFWVFQANEPARRFYERRGCVPVEFTDGSGNDERTPDVRYEWKPR